MLPGPLLSPSYCNLRKYVGVTLLNDTTINIPAEGKTRICEIEAQVINYLQRLGMRDTEIFGLAIDIDDEFMFVLGENKVSKYAPRQWKESPNLRENVLRFGQALRIDVALILAGFALQADVGNYCPEKHQGAYFDPSTYLPQWMIEQVGVSYIVEAATGLHRKNEGLSPPDAQAQFIREASLSEAPHNIHLFKLKRRKHDPSSQVELSICDKGIGIYEEEDGGVHIKSKKMVQSFPWSSISDLSFEKKKFEIRAHGYPGKLTFYTSTDDKSRHLLHLCRTTHQFSRLQKPRPCELRSSSYERKKYRDSFSSSDYASMSDQQSHDIGGDCNRNSQRVSICSSISSGVTSAALQDRILSLEESQADLNCSLASNKNLDMGHGRGGVDRSHSTISNRTDMSDADDKILCNLLSENIGSTWEALARNSDSAGLGRAESIHSSSSQHSSSTVRSRYSLSINHPLHRPEFTLGAELADLSLAPDLPELADLPTMTTNIVQEGEDVTDSQLHTTHNCCSTCCDDTASIGTDDDDNEEIEDVEASRNDCHCGSCSVCLIKNKEKELVQEENMYLNYGKSPEIPQELFHGSPVFTTLCDDASVVVQPDLDETLASNYNFSEDLNNLENDNSFLNYYKGGLSYVDCMKGSIDSSNQQDLGIEIPNIRSPGIMKNSSPKSLLKSPSPLQDEQTLDYSVESAHAALSAAYHQNREFLTWALLANSQNANLIDNYAEHNQPSPVAMSKVTTVTPVNIASSKFSDGSNTHDNQPPSYPPNYKALDSIPEPIISETSTASSSEAPAKFITSKPRITILKAHTQLAATTAPSFSSVPLSRPQVHTLPQVQIRHKANPVQSLQRVALPESRPLSLAPTYKEELMHHSGFFNLPPHQIPVIIKNNYLDVHASANLNKEMLKSHPEQVPSKQPRSLYLKNQKKRLQQQQINEKHQKEKIHQQLMSETVHQPSAYAQGVGVPLLPPPTFARCSGPSKPHSRNHNSLFHKSSPNLCQQPVIEQQCFSYPQCAAQPDSIGSQNFIYQPHIKNFFQNPPPPTPHPGFGVGACPTNIHVYPESLSPTYQCASDPGTYPTTLQAQHYPHQSLQSVLATVYTNQVTQSQIEQFKAQLNSDTDYVIYPHKDPAISRQEYMDAKQGQYIASRAQKNFDYSQQIPPNGSNIGFVHMPPPYRSTKSSLLYRSTPNVAVSLAAPGVLSSYPSYQSLASQGSTHQPGSSSGYSSMARGRYFSQQSLASSFSSVPSGYSASTQSLTGSFDPYVEQNPLPNSPTTVMRVRSDESILSSSGHNEDETVPFSPTNVPLQHPPYRPKEVLNNSGEQRTANVLPKRATGRSESTSKSLARIRSRSRPRVTLQQVRECGSQLDVPFLSALCSDSSIAQKQDGVNYKKPFPTTSSSTSTFAPESSSTATSTTSAPPTHPPANSAATQKAKVAAARVEEEEDAAEPANSTNLRYSVSGIYTTNQVPAIHRKAKGAKFSNGVHEHPRPPKQQLKQHLLQAGAKLKHSKSLKEATQFPL